MLSMRSSPFLFGVCCGGGLWAETLASRVNAIDPYGISRRCIFDREIPKQRFLRQCLKIIPHLIATFGLT